MLKKLLKYIKKNKMSFIFDAVCTLLFVWFLVSFIDVNLHNVIGKDGGTQNAWNIFYILFK